LLAVVDFLHVKLFARPSTDSVNVLPSLETCNVLVEVVTLAATPRAIC